VLDLTYFFRVNLPDRLLSRFSVRLLPKPECPSNRGKSNVLLKSSGERRIDGTYKLRWPMINNIVLLVVNIASPFLVDTAVLVSTQRLSGSCARSVNAIQKDPIMNVYSH
jgi:hypothetical protein